MCPGGVERYDACGGLGDSEVQRPQSCHTIVIHYSCRGRLEDYGARDLVAESNVGSGTSSPWGSDFERPGNYEGRRHAGQHEENNEYEDIALGDTGVEGNSVPNGAEGEVKKSADEERGDKTGEEPFSKSGD